MGKFLFDFIIKEIKNVLKNNNEALGVDSTLFRQGPGGNHTASIIVNSDDPIGT